MTRRRFLHSTLCLTALSGLSPNLIAGDEPYKVTVLAILASEQHTEIDKRLVDFAKEVQKKNPKLTGFKVAHICTEKLALGVTKTCALADRQTMEVTLNASKTEEGKVTITLKPPNISQISYLCVCERAFSMATNHFTKDKEQLFIAVTAKECKGPDKGPAKTPPPMPTPMKQ